MKDSKYSIISLLTDFGTSDTYVGVMKAVILGRCPWASIVDLTHDIPAQDVMSAGFALNGAWRYFPGGAIHCAVVDPGVGTDRKVLAAYEDGQYFVGPDNGLLALAIGGKPEKLIEVKNKEFMLKSVSHTFHGRDIFAPVSAALAMGVPIEDLGDPTTEWVDAMFPEASVAPDNGLVEGEVVYIDHFGNLITNVISRTIPYMPRVEFEGEQVEHLVKTYNEVEPGTKVALIGSSGYLEIAINQGNAAEVLGKGLGAKVKVTRGLPELD